MRLFAALILFASLLGADARADNREDVERFIAAAAKLYDQLEFERALAQLQSARAMSPGAATVARICVYEGIIYGDMGDFRDRSQAAFKEAFALDPDVRLPLRVSPKIEKDFEAIRRQMAR